MSGADGLPGVPLALPLPVDLHGVGPHGVVPDPLPIPHGVVLDPLPAASAAGKVALMRLFLPAARCSDEGNGGCGVDWGWERIRDLLTRLPPVGSVGESWRVLFQM